MGVVEGELAVDDHKEDGGDGVDAVRENEPGNHELEDLGKLAERGDRIVS